MLRVGLTGGLGSGKSTAARMFAAHGAHVLSSDEIGREVMQPGQTVYSAIVAHFGKAVKLVGGGLDRAELARIAFEEGRVEELNAIVHPAVIARQEELTDQIAARDVGAVVMVESALVFETKYDETKYGEAKADGGDGRRQRFDRVILVTAPEEMKIARFVGRASRGAVLRDEDRAGLEAEARRRLDQQIPDEKKAGWCDYVLTNGGSLKELEWQVDQLWPILERDARVAQVHR